MVSRIPEGRRSNMRGKRVRALVLMLTIGLLTIGCSSDTGADVDPEATTTAPMSGTEAPEATTTTGGDEDTPDAGEPAGGSECTVVITGDREETWTFDGLENRVGVATDYWFSDEAIREAVEELGGSYDEFVEKGEPLVAFLGVYCSASTDPMDPGQGVDVRATNSTRAADLPMEPGIYPIVGGGTAIDEGPGGTMVADVTVVGDEIYETVPDSGSLEITSWDIGGIEGSFSFASQEMFSENPKEIEVIVQFSLVCEAPPYTC